MFTQEELYMLETNTRNRISKLYSNMQQKFGETQRTEYVKQLELLNKIQAQMQITEIQKEQKE